MKAEDIKSVDDVSNYIEGCLNDFNEGISTLDETNKYLHELTVRIIEIAQASLQPISEEDMEIAFLEYSLQGDLPGTKHHPYNSDDFKAGVDYVILRGVAKESVPSDEEIHLMRVFISYAANSYKMINNKTSKSTVYRMIQSRASELNERLSMSTTSKSQ